MAFYYHKLSLTGFLIRCHRKNLVRPEEQPLPLFVHTSLGLAVPHDTCTSKQGIQDCSQRGRTYCRDLNLFNNFDSWESIKGYKTSIYIYKKVQWLRKHLLASNTVVNLLYIETSCILLNDQSNIFKNTYLSWS